MSRKNECMKPKRKFHIEGLIMIILILVSLFLYVCIVREYITQLQWKTFCNSQTIILTQTLGIWYVFEIISAIIIVLTLMYLIMYKIEQIKNMNEINKKSHVLRKCIITIATCFSLIFISNISYCRVDIDGIYIREIRTLFFEKKYTWETVKSVEIKYYSSGRTGGRNLLYLLNFDIFSVNIKNDNSSMKIETIDDAEKQLHEIVKMRNIPVYKDISIYDDRIDKFLKLLGE